MPDYTETVRLIKKAAVEAVHAEKPTSVFFGTVVSVSPLKINVEQKFNLGQQQLVLTHAVKDHKVDITVDFNTETFFKEGKPPDEKLTDVGHKHLNSGKKSITVHNGLFVNDTVLLIQIQGGQKFVVVDKI